VNGSSRGTGIRLDGEKGFQVDIVKLTSMSWISKCITVAAELGIADKIGDQALSHGELARLTEADPQVLRRLLQALASVGVFKRDVDGKFRNSVMSESLKTDHPQSMRHLCMLFGGMYYEAWGELRHTVLTGKPASHKVFGGSIYHYMDDHQDVARTYDLAMASLARPVVAEMLKRYDLSEVRTVVDVGGGSGTMLHGILTAHSQISGICADRPDVCARAAAELEGSGDQDLAARLSFRPSDFFTEVPGDGDIYLLKNVLHNWSVDSCRRILKVIGCAMNRQAAVPPRLFVIEPLVAEDGPGAMRALFQMVICEEGTHGLSYGQMRGLLDVSGFDILSATRLSTEHYVFECARR
jgi:C-methyltransferase